ncbi:unnamed protein product [Moneuplotes crassus]|uniref:BZIP domain-containing protein n=1 Tax=Euplotes crassus TaxID=5936 RepID=A0AAD1XPF8_EUPCR|nr:unnamed protein product [Moneuplotes crassus]
MENPKSASTSQTEHKKPPKTIKQRSKEHRARKKKFIEDTLHQCNLLKDQVAQLQQENTQLREKLALREKEPEEVKQEPKKRFEHSLHEYEDYVYNSLSKKILEDPKEVRYSELEQATEHVWDWSDDRVDYVKTLFNKILENMIGLGSKCYFACHNVIPIKNWYGKSKVKKRGRKYFDKNSEISKIQSLFPKMEITANAKEAFTSFNKELTQQHRKLRKIARGLVRHRNSLLNLYQDMKTFMETTNYLEWYNKIDVSNDCQIFNTIRSTSLISTHNFYKIPKKAPDQTTYQDCELTE